MAAITSLSSEASTNKYTVVITNAGFAGKEDDFKTLVTAIFNKIDTVITDVNTHKTQEEIEDIVGAMFDGGTETRVSATYDDTSGKINLVVDDMSGDNNTTYSISCVDGDNSDEEKIRLTAGGSGSGTDDVVLEAGTGLSIARDGDKITFTNTVTDNDTTYSAGTNLSLAGTTFNLADASLLTKGAAAFHQDYFSASSGTISIKSEGIDTDEIKGRAVTYAKMQNVTDARMLGNNSGSASSPTEMSKTDVLSFLNVSDGANANVVEIVEMQLYMIIAVLLL